MIPLDETGGKSKLSDSLRGLVLKNKFSQSYAVVAKLADALA